MIHKKRKYGILNFMRIFDENLILETINMIKLHNFDIRTVTLSLSLRDCISEDVSDESDTFSLSVCKG